ncbi:hypothetical protein FB570_105159 [Streptomyces sp. T12]|uniref:hypothetical protein n=1 Tax=Streptomyces sp. T12 TaxID=477697 RepID=UPI0011A3B457|nr:hypothetical protein [Streptomyces sp. T12]TWD22759.1 hypothetical protein FB570_105159 [Streptomyces sp. T12]
MGIESDQVVYEYLSRVGDVAQQRQLPSAARMRLVAELRDEIDRRRAKAVVDSPAAVRRIIARMGTPTEVVVAAEDSPGAVPGASEQSAAVPAQREPVRGAKAGGVTSGDAKSGGAKSGGGRGGGVLRRVVPRPRPSAPPPAPADVPSPPHRAGSDELGDSATQPDWWRVDNSPFGAGDEVPGFVGGVEIPELLKPPPSARERPASEAAPAEPGVPAAAADGAGAAPAVRRRRLVRLPSGSWSNPLLLVAAASLVVGAVLGNWFALILGWLIAYASRRLTRPEVKAAVVVLPGLSLVGGIVWIWGRTAGRWGEPIAEGQMNAALAETWPWVIRTAAITSALFLLWRSQRER